MSGGAAEPEPEGLVNEHRISLHLVSDATGETLNSIARATVAQFEHAHVTYHRWNLIRTPLHLHRVLEGIKADPGPVLSSMMDRKLKAELNAACGTLGVQLVSVLDPIIAVLQDTLHEPAKGRPGSQYVLDAEYYKRIDAMHFVLAHDDGQAAAELHQADVVLVGVSRASKTPTCFYLANRGVKAANVPLVPDLPLLQELMQLRGPVIGLTIAAQTLVEIRRTRVRIMAPGGIMGKITEAENPYIDVQTVRDELNWARRLCNRNHWPMIDVSHRSIEETAAAVIEIKDNWLDRPKPVRDQFKQDASRE